MRISPLHRFCALAASAALVSSLSVQPPIADSGAHLSFGEAASAKSSGGRSGGGSFKSSPSRPSGGGSSSPSRNNNSPNNNPGYYNNNPGPVIVPVPVGGGNTYYNNGQPQAVNSQASTGSMVLGFIILVGGTALVIFVIYLIIKAISNAAKGGGAIAKKERELTNDIVTVSKIQVGLLAQARSIQAELTQLALEVDTDTPEGLQQLLQESALALLRTPENWSHVLASSQVVKSRDQAQEVFGKLSVTERTKFSVESLVNVGGRVSQRELKLDPEKDPASYIVVTLLVGTAYDKPLFTEIRTEQALTEVLEKLASLSPEYLMTFELLWSPQAEADSLTYDELLMEYTEMVPI